MKKSTKKHSQLKKLENVEEAGYDMGNISYEGFKNTQNISSLKGAVAAYRLSMQAIRDQIKFKISK